MSEADETIIARIIFENAEALKNAADMRDGLDALKKKMLELSSLGKVALKDLAEGLIKEK